MATICRDQVIALHAHSRMAIGWLVAFVLFVGVTALGDDLFLRVEMAGRRAASGRSPGCRCASGRPRATQDEPTRSTVGTLAELPV